MRNFQKYLEDPHIYGLFHLLENKETSFHWSDYANTISHYQKVFANKDRFPAFAEEYEKIERDIEELKSRHLWLTTMLRKRCFSMYDFYLHVLSSKHKNPLLEQFISDPSCRISKKMDSHNYREFSEYTWYDKELYLSAVYYLLLRDELEERSFRLRNSSPVVIQLLHKGKNYIREVRVSQFTLDGLLLQASPEVFQDISRAEGMKIYLDKEGLSKLFEIDPTHINPATSSTQRGMLFTTNPESAYTINLDKLKETNIAYARALYIDYELITGFGAEREQLKKFLSGIREQYARCVESVKSASPLAG